MVFLETVNYRLVASQGHVKKQASCEKRQGQAAPEGVSGWMLGGHNQRNRYLIDTLDVEVDDFQLPVSQTYYKNKTMNGVRHSCHKFKP